MASARSRNCARPECRLSTDATLTDALSGRVALVTGGSGGIGAAICRLLGSAGAHVAVGYGYSADAAEAADLALAILRNGYITNHVFSVDGGMHPR